MSYQDAHYFLTQGNGSWGQQAWAHDRIGSLSEVSPPDRFTYSYLANPAGGHSPKLSRIEPASAGEPGSRLDFSYDAAGNQTTAAAVTGEDSGRTSLLDYSGPSELYSYDEAGNVLNGALSFSYGDDRRMSQSETSGGAVTAYAYDGRGFLSQSVSTLSGALHSDDTVPTYSSAGLLFHRFAHKSLQPYTLINPVRDSHFYVFYFAGRPVATLDSVTQGTTIGGFTTTSTWQYLTADHLGTPILVTGPSGAQVWQGGFEPFGAAYNSPPTILRFPGQWFDATWNGNKDIGLNYNVHRWYDARTGRYTQADPLGTLRSSGLVHPFSYAESSPLVFYDPWGLDAITQDQALQDCFYCLFFRASFGNTSHEEAAWIINTNGTYSCQIWPPTFSRNSTSVQSIPPGAVAVIHTHPRPTVHKPSSGDLATSNRLRKPIYVIHPTGGIWKYDPSTQQTTQEEGPSWVTGPKQRCQNPRKPC